MADRIEVGSRVRIGRVPGADGKTGKVMQRDDMIDGNRISAPRGRPETAPFWIVRVDDGGRMVPVPDGELSVLDE